MRQVLKFIAEAIAFAQERRGRRSFVVGLVGLGLLFGASWLRWFAVPEGHPDLPLGTSAVFSVEAGASYFYKILCIAAIGGIVLVALRLAEPRRVVAGIVGVFFAALLFFPHIVMIWSPAVSARATWLDLEHLNLIATTGDEWEGSEVKAFDWKANVYASDLPGSAAVIRTPSLHPTLTPFGSLKEMLGWLGYSTAYCNFVCFGWFMAMAGALLLLVSTARSARGPDFEPLTVWAKTFAMAMGAAIAVSLVPAGLCAWQIDRARAAYERGEFALALDELESAASIVPAIRTNGDFVEQRGLVDTRLNRNTAEAELHRARALVQTGHFEEAEAYFAALAGASHIGDGVRLEATRQLIRRGIRKLNSGAIGSAIETLEGVLRRDPCDIKASYALQLAYLRTGESDAVQSLGRRMRSTYAFFNSLDKLPVLGAVQENVMYAAYLRGDVTATQAARQLLTDPSRLAKEAP
jgi:tetratricopeptide (TPR) repeat protein